MDTDYEMRFINNKYNTSHFYSYVLITSSISCSYK